MGLEGLDGGADPLSSLVERDDRPGPVVGHRRPKGLLRLLGLEHGRPGDGGVVDGRHRAEGVPLPRHSPPQRLRTPSGPKASGAMARQRS